MNVRRRRCVSTYVKWVPAAAAIALVVAACAGTGSESGVPAEIELPTTTTTRPPASTTTTAVPATATARIPAGVIEGALPDGTAYRVTGAEPERVTGVHAVITMDLSGGGSQIVGVTRFEQGGRSVPNEWFGDRLRINIDGWIIEIDAYDEFLAVPGARELLRTGITARTRYRMPVLQLSSPLRFATSDEVPSYMEVEYETFSVLRGCDESLAPLACTSRPGAQVVSADVLYAPAPAPPDGPVGLALLGTALSPLPAGHLDRGPLDPRGGHSVTWTGDELIVWGGERSENGPSLSDGAAFNPATNRWRPVAESPLAARTYHAAAWTGTEVLIVGGGAFRDGAAYDPAADSWRPVADAPVSIGMNTPWTWDGARLLVWSLTDGAVAVYDFAADRWHTIAGPALPAERGALRSSPVGLFAVGTSGCGPLVSARLDAGLDAWSRLPDIDLTAGSYLNCGLPQSATWAGGRLIVWGDNGVDGATAAYDARLADWVEISPIPQAGCDFWQTPISLDADSFVAFGLCDDASLYDASADSWTPVLLPGVGSDRYSEWTGTDIITWGDTCCYGTGGRPFTVDAWQYAP